jgi:iron complex outermembrane receptor protein
VPSMLLQRVDIVTGGASAVYGSDAVTGVVNFITDRNFNGYKFEAQTGRSQQGDGDEVRIGIAGGMPIMGGRGHIEGSYEYYNSPGIFTKLTREWGRHVWSSQGGGTVALPNKMVDNTRLSSTSFMGVIKNGPLADMVFRQNGQLDKFQHGSPTNATGVESGGDGAYYSWASLLSLFQSDQAFGRFDYDLTDNVHFYVEGTGMLSHNMNNHQNNETNRNTTLAADNAFLAPQYQQAMLSRGVTTFTFAKMWDDVPGTVPGLQPETYNKGWFVNTGLEGEIAGAWRWDISYNHSTSTQRTRNNHNLDQERLSAAIDAVRAPDGRIVCRTDLTSPGLFPGCVPLNMFGPTAESAEAIKYIQQKTTYVAQYSMDDIGASIAGSPFSTWAGPVQMALSGEWRKLNYQNESNAQPLPANCTGLRFNCNGSTLKYINDVLGSRTPVSQSVKEAAIEADVPLITDSPFAEALTINGAARYTDYDTSGSVETWKVGVNWVVNDQITFRGVRSRDIRAPNLSELFAPRRVVPAGCTDQFLNIIGQCPFITDSSTTLEPEIAQTWTAGVVLRPHMIPRFSLAVDWYRISLGNAITTIQGQNQTIQALCYASAPSYNSEFCALQQRPFPFSNRTPANFVEAFYSKPVNAQTVLTTGVDIEANYSLPLGPGNLTMRSLISYQPKLTTVQFPGAPLLNDADTPGLAKWRATLFLNYNMGNWGLSVQEKWHAGTARNNDRTRVYVEGRLPSAAYTNATVTYRMGEASFFLTVRNVFNKEPFPVSNGGSVPGLFGGYTPGDDNIGRYFNIGVKLRH